MTFRPSVLPDRDNNILDTFVRSFERARQLRRADQADARAQAEFEARQEDREASRESAILQSNLAIAADPALQFTEQFDINQPGIGVGQPVPEGGPPSRFSEVLGPTRQVQRPGTRIGRGPGGRDVFFSREAGEQAEETRIRREASLERELGAPEREAERGRVATERTELAEALRSQGTPEEEIRALVRDPDAARRRINAFRASQEREEGEGVSTTEQQRSRLEADIEERAEAAGLVLQPGQAGLLSRGTAAQREDFFAPIREAEVEIIKDRIDAVTDGLDRLDRDRQDLTPEEFNRRRSRLFREQGFEGIDDFNNQRARLQAAAAGTLERPPREGGTEASIEGGPAPGPAAGSGLEDLEQPEFSLSTTQHEEAAAFLKVFPAEEREQRLNETMPRANDADREAILALVR